GIYNIGVVIICPKFQGLCAIAIYDPVDPESVAAVVLRIFVPSPVFYGQQWLKAILNIISIDIISPNILLLVVQVTIIDYRGVVLSFIWTYWGVIIAIGSSVRNIIIIVSIKFDGYRGPYPVCICVVSILLWWTLHNLVISPTTVHGIPAPSAVIAGSTFYIKVSVVASGSTNPNTHILVVIYIDITGVVVHHEGKAIGAIAIL